MNSPSGCSWLLSCLQGGGVIPACWRRLGQPQRATLRIQCGPMLAWKACSAGPEPLLALPPRIASTTQRVRSATSARLASLETPRRPQPLPAGPVLAHTLTPPAGQSWHGAVILGGGAVQQAMGRLWAGRWEARVQILTWSLNCSMPFGLSGPQLPSFPI